MILSVPVSRATLDKAIEFRNTLLEKINEGNFLIIIDLGKVEFIDSTFLGAIVVGSKAAISKGGEIILASLTDQVSMTFSLTKLDSRFKIFKSVEDVFAP